MKLLLQHGDEWLRFSDPVDILTARTPDEVFHCLEAIALRHSASRRKGRNLWAAGFISYEAASAFDDALKTHPPGRLPLLQFGLFENVERTLLSAPVQAESLHHSQLGLFKNVEQAFLPAHSCKEEGRRECLPHDQLGEWMPFKNVEQAFLPAHSCKEEGRQECLPHYQLGEWTPSVTRDEYVAAIAKIKEHIAAGDTYQVNYTFRLNAGFSGDPFSFFCDLSAAQQGRYAAFIETDEFSICSASPELFFELKDGVITSRPMKGTMPRALTAAADLAVAEALKNSPKDRAENIMIVDMIRNDIGRIANAGSVETLSRFDVEKYPTVWQLTSTVTGRVELNNGINHEDSKGTKSHQENLRESSCTLCLCGEKTVGLADLIRALFPCASITGAPKAKTMELIKGLEKTPRGLYTGAIGFIAPDGAAQFNVAIRTAVVDRNAGTVEYGIGGGIVWDSVADAEYEEAITKARILVRRSPETQSDCFQLLETMLWEDGEIFLLERHLKRLADSAEYFDFLCDLNQIREYLRNLRLNNPTRIRLLLDRDGTFGCTYQPLHTCAGVEQNICTGNKYNSTAIVHTCASVDGLVLAKNPVNSQDVFLYHKTTNRAVYKKAKADFPDADDVLLFNERGEVTESCIANVVVELDGRKVTPPVSCGLLAGTLRDSLLESGEIEEQVVTLDDLRRAEAIWLINSVRKWRSVSTFAKISVHEPFPAGTIFSENYLSLRFQSGASSG